MTSFLKNGRDKIALCVFLMIEFALARNIFFVHTSTEYAMSPLTKCVLESTARLNPFDDLLVYSNTLQDVPSLGISSISKVNYRVVDVLLDTPLSQGVWSWENADPTTLSDALRLALVYKFGGVYLDMDLIRFIFFLNQVSFFLIQIHQVFESYLVM